MLLEICLTPLNSLDDISVRNRVMVIGGKSPQQVILGRAGSNGKEDSKNGLFKLGSISRLHGKMIIQNNQLYYVDHGSKNGSMLNDSTLTAYCNYLVNDGDILTLAGGGNNIPSLKLRVSLKLDDRSVITPPITPSETTAAAIANRTTTVMKSDETERSFLSDEEDELDYVDDDELFNLATSSPK